MLVRVARSLSIALVCLLLLSILKLSQVIDCLKLARHLSHRRCVHCAWAEERYPSMDAFGSAGGGGGGGGFGLHFAIGSTVGVSRAAAGKPRASSDG